MAKLRRIGYHYYFELEFQFFMITDILTFPLLCFAPLLLGASMKGWPLVILTTGGPLLLTELLPDDGLASPLTRVVWMASFDLICSEFCLCHKELMR